MKPESRGSLLQRSFRKSFRRNKKVEEVEKKSAAQIAEEEQKIIEELRALVNDVIRPDVHDDNFLRRCIKAKGSDVKEAEKQVRLIVNYQRVLRIDSSLKECRLTQVNKGLLGTGWVGFDKDGDIVRLINLGHIDLKGLIHSVSTIELIKIFVWYFEQDAKLLREENKKTGKNACQCVAIFDMENLSASQAMYKPVIDTTLTGLKLLQEYYHDFLKTVFIINAPSIFSTLYKMLKPAIYEDLQKRIKIFSYEDWKEPLLQMVDADVLPKQLGGNRVDQNNDPRCGSLIGQGGTIPDMLYRKEESFLDPEMPGVESTAVPAGSCLNIPVEIKEIGSVLKWHIHAKDNDVAIALYYDPASGTDSSEQTEEEAKEDETDELLAKKKGDQKAILAKLEQLTPLIRTQCQVTPEIGHTFAWKTGKYILHLDNSYSWMSPKQIMYKLEVIPPGEQYDTNEDKLVDSIKNL